MATSSSTFSPLNNYRRISIIGKGSFGVISLCDCLEDGNRYVIKEVNLSSLSEKMAHDAKVEASVLERLNHPNVIRSREAFLEGPILYIVMEYAAGGDLYKLMKERNGVKVRFVCPCTHLASICLTQTGCVCVCVRACLFVRPAAP